MLHSAFLHTVNITWLSSWNKSQYYLQKAKQYCYNVVRQMRTKWGPWSIVGQNVVLMRTLVLNEDLICSTVRVQWSQGVITIWEDKNLFLPTNHPGKWQPSILVFAIYVPVTHLSYAPCRPGQRYTFQQARLRPPPPQYCIRVSYHFRPDPVYLGWLSPHSRTPSSTVIMLALQNKTNNFNILNI